MDFIFAEVLKSHDEVLFPRYSLQTLRNRHLLHQAGIQKCNESSRENPKSLTSTTFVWCINFWCHNMSTPYIHHPKPDKGHVHCLRNSPWDLSQHTPLSQLLLSPLVLVVRVHSEKKTVVSLSATAMVSGYLHGGT